MSSEGNVQLCRAVCGVRGKTLIVNLPGSKKGSEVREIFDKYEYLLNNDFSLICK